ncbi:hypothetical protein D3C73_871690 [compost metagenome]
MTVGGVATQVLVLQIVATCGIAIDAPRKASDPHVTVELAHIEARAPAGIGPEVRAGLETGQAALAVRADGTALAHLTVHAHDAGPGLALALRDTGIADAPVQGGQHSQVGLAQLLGQGGVQGHFGAVRRRARPRRRGAAQVRAAGRVVELVLVGARQHRGRQREDLALDAGAVLGPDDLDAVARGLTSQAANVGDGHLGVATGHGAGAAEHHLVHRAAVVAQGRAHGQGAALADPGAGDSEDGARRAAHEADGAAVADAGHALVVARQVQRGAARDRDGAAWAEGVDHARAHRALGDGGGATVAVVGRTQDQRTAALLGQICVAADAAHEGGVVGAGVEKRIIGARHADGIGDDQAVSDEAQRSAVVHRQHAAAQRLAVPQIDAPRL